MKAKITEHGTIIITSETDHEFALMKFLHKCDASGSENYGEKIYRQIHIKPVIKPQS